MSGIHALIYPCLAHAFGAAAVLSDEPSVDLWIDFDRGDLILRRGAERMTLLTQAELRPIGAASARAASQAAVRLCKERIDKIAASSITTGATR